MGQVEVLKYSSDLKEKWNQFLTTSRNGVFLFDRNFMEYHSDRFQDHSLLFFIEGELKAIFPANLKDQTLYSHQGLTFGGLIYSIDTRSNEVGLIFEALKNYCKELSISKIIFKPTPYFLHSIPAQDDLYYLHQMGASVVRRDLSSLVDLDRDYKYSKGRKWIINKAIKSEITCEPSQDWHSFYEILSHALKSHGTKPVHSLQELTLLHSRFPEKFQLYTAVKQGKVLAGALVFNYGKTIHTQYLANSEEGRELGALDLILDYLIKQSKANKLTYLSFGISTVEEGRVINSGLLQQKEGFGGRGVVHDWYEFKI